MRNLHGVVFIAITASIVLSACGLASTGGDLLSQIKSRGYILVSTDTNHAPQSFLNNDGQRPESTQCPRDTLTSAEMQGFDVDVAAELGKRLGVDTCFATQTWDAITAGAWADKWDISVGSVPVTREYQKVLDFTIAYYYTPAVVAVAKASGITSLDQVAGKALCVGASTPYEDWLKGKLDLPAENIFTKPPAGVTVVSLDTDQQCAQEIEAGRTDFAGYVSSQTVVDADIAAGLPVRQLGGPVYVEDFAAAFDKESSFNTADLRAELNRLLTSMHSDGTLTTLSNKWFQTDLTQAPAQ
jgi:polar amino acid transport system substrate-binding protein